MGRVELLAEEYRQRGIGGGVGWGVGKSARGKGGGGGGGARPRAPAWKHVIHAHEHAKDVSASMHPYVSFLKIASLAYTATNVTLIHRQLLSKRTCRPCDRVSYINFID